MVTKTKNFNINYSFILFNKIASDGGNLDATCILANCYENGTGVEKNLEEAIRLCKFASNGGNSDATNILALLLKL